MYSQGINFVWKEYRHHELKENELFMFSCFSLGGWKQSIIVKIEVLWSSNQAQPRLLLLIHYSAG